MTLLPTFPADFTAVRGGDGGFRVALSQAGQWWWITPAGKPQVVCGVQGLDASVGSMPADAQVAQWGFNLMMPPVAESFCGGGLPYLHDLQLSRCGVPTIHEDGVRLPDVFDPTWDETVEQVLNARVPTPMLVGWLGDADLRWGRDESNQTSAPALNRPGLLQVCLGLDPAYRAYHSAWEFVLARHGGERARVAEAWGVDLPSRGAVRQHTREERMFEAPAYQRDLAAFTTEFAQRYFSVLRDAARHVNRRCLLCSPPLSADTPAVVRRTAASTSDVVLATRPGLVGTETPEILLEHNWSKTRPVPDSSGGESALEAMMRQGREKLLSLLVQPSVIGYAWSPFRRGDLAVDEPFGVGLVDENGRENPVHTHPLAAINAAASTLRAHAATPTLAETE